LLCFDAAWFVASEHEVDNPPRHTLRPMHHHKSWELFWLSLFVVTPACCGVCCGAVALV
jgi:hypothetical protein